ncbi:hypothetical protein [Zobellella aerophila]|uniref:Uncharacterized protein n=1 Tax=Zobellella aerophila TaxID=870480 RepID=A0ABP6W5M8_9GAMM
MTSALSSAILLVYGLLAGDAEELFWNLFVFSAIISLLPYLAMHLSCLKLRRSRQGRGAGYPARTGRGPGVVIAASGALDKSH